MKRGIAQNLMKKDMNNRHNNGEGQDHVTRTEFDYQPNLSGLHGLEAVAEAQEVQQHHKDSQQELDVRDPRHPSYWEPDDLQQEEQEVCKVQVLEKNHRDFSVLPSNRDCEKKEKTYQDQMSSTALPAAHGFFVCNNVDIYR